VFPVRPTISESESTLFLTIYTSERPSRWSATTFLVSSTGETFGKIIGNCFSHLPLCAIELLLLSKEGETEIVEIKCKALMTRACAFTYHGWEFKWRYVRADEGAKMNGHTLLILQRHKEGVLEKHVVARLVRDRVADEDGGTNATDAGRGGRLELRIGEEEGMKVEVLVVMSCLVMLKKEMDRRRHSYPIDLFPLRRRLAGA
jgi:hypothetical protein